MLIDHYPLLGLRLRTPRLELRLPSSEELGQLADLAARGIHDPEDMPFFIPWTNQSPAGRARAVVQYNWLRWGNLASDHWSLLFTVFCGDTVVGQQDIGGTDFSIRREAATGSWLGLEHQGRGIGTEMRAAVLHLAFMGLGATHAISAAHENNEASLGVSRKLGYVADGIDRQVVSDQLVTVCRLRLTRERWEHYRRVPVTIEGLEPCLPLLGCESP